jgi:hypothetical protein
MQKNGLLKKYEILTNWQQYNLIGTRFVNWAEYGSEFLANVDVLLTKSIELDAGNKYCFGLTSNFDPNWVRAFEDHGTGPQDPENRKIHLIEERHHNQRRTFKEFADASWGDWCCFYVSGGLELNYFNTTLIDYFDPTTMSMFRVENWPYLKARIRDRDSYYEYRQGGFRSEFGHEMTPEFQLQYMRDEIIAFDGLGKIWTEEKITNFHKPIGII